MSRLASLAGFFAALALSSQAAASVIVDTGTPQPRAGGTTLNNNQFYAGQFSTGDDVITRIQVFIGGAFQLGDVNVTIRANSAGLPGTLLYSHAIEVDEVQPLANWNGPLDLDWALAAGTYWIGIEVPPDSAFGGYFPNTAPNPLGAEAIYQDGTWRRVDWLNAGIRINADTSANSGIPEPGTWALLIAGFSGAGAVMRMRRRKIA